MPNQPWCLFSVLKVEITYRKTCCVRLLTPWGTSDGWGGSTRREFFMTRARNAHCSFWGPLKVGQIQCLKKGLEDLCPSLEFLNALRQMMNWYRSSPFFLSRKLKTKYYWVIVVASHVESVKHWSIWNGKASFCFYASAWSVLFTREQYWGSYYLTNLFTLMLRHYGFGCVLHLFVKH